MLRPASQFAKPNRLAAAAVLLGIALLLTAGPAWSQPDHAAHQPPTRAGSTAAPAAPRATAAASPAPPPTPSEAPVSSSRPAPQPAPTAARLQTHAPPVEQLVAEALARYPSLTALSKRVDAAREEVGPAGSLADPMLGAMYQSVGPPWNPMPLMSMAQVEYSQPLYYPGKRDARRRAASAEVKSRAARLLDVQWQIATEVRQTYARIFALDREQESVVGAQELVRTLVEAVSARYSAGQAEQEAVAKITLERFMLSERLTDLEAERAALVAVINQLTERRQGTAFGTIQDLPGTLRIPSNPSAAALSRSPTLLMQRAEIEAARGRLDVASLESKPNFLVGLAGGSTLEGEPVITARFGMELPIFTGTKQEPMVRAARHQLDAANADLAAAESQVGSALERLLAQWKRDNEQIERYEQAILPQTNNAMQSALSAYVTGRGDFSNLVEDFRLWLDARVALARRRADRFMTWSELHALTAGPIQTRSP